MSLVSSMQRDKFETKLESPPQNIAIARILFLVIGFLAAIVVVAVLFYPTESGRPEVKSAKVEVQMLEQAIGVYQVNNGRYPAELIDLIRRPSDKRLASKWGGPYLKEDSELVDPWEAPYQYAAPGKRNPSGFDIWSFGPDGEDGTEDDIGNWVR